MIIDIGKNNDGSFHFAGVDIRPNETYIDAVCRTTPLRQRVLWGLSLKLMSLRMQQKFYEEADVLIEFSRLFHMTDEEYDLEVSGSIRK